MNRSRVLCVGVLLAFSSGVSAQLQSPEEFLGHPVGADYRLVKWPRIVEYFEHLDANSERITVRELGTTTEGRPFIFAEISDAETIANLQTHREAQRRLADPRLISGEVERAELIEQAKVAILVNCQLHSSEVAASQMSMEMAYNLVSGDTPRIREILEKTIILLVPSANPDGQHLVADWYDSTIGTPWEGRASMPRLYQWYAGHDNNRDWFMLNLKETRYTTKVLYEEWFPTIVWDVHQMGNQGPRLFVPPFHDPKNFNVHPGIDQTLLIIGGHMAGDLAQKGMKGVVHSAIYDNWWAGGFRTTPYRHNMIGILTEAASVNLASPIFQRKSELRGARRGLPQYEMTTNFPDPWPGGWWRLRDIVDYELEIGMSLFTLAARYHDRFQGNYVQFGEEAIEKGLNEPPFAWLVPPDQRDPGSAYQMLERLSATAIEIHQAEEDFTADGVDYPAGTFIMYTAQPYRPHLMDMMERQVYPDRVMYPGGPAEPPYDMAGWTLPLQMGVRHVEVAASFDARATKVEALAPPESSVVDPDAEVFIVPAGRNDDYRLMRRLYDRDVPFIIVDREWDLLEPSPLLPESFKEGALMIIPRPEQRGKVSQWLDGLSIDAYGVPGKKAHEIRGEISGEIWARPARTALYQPYAASMEEGWTRLVLDNFEVAYETVHNAGIRAGNLRARFDCIVLPSIGTRTILEGYPEDTTAPEYVGGIGEKGVVTLQVFVEQGGTLVCMDQSSNLPIDRFNIPVRNIVRGLPTSDFYCPGSVLRLSMDTTHPVGYGMPEWYSGYFARSQAFELVRKEEKPEENDDDNGVVLKPAEKRDPFDRFKTTVVSRYSDTVLLESGWIRGGELIADKPAIVEVEYGEGRILLIGISVQRRGQPHGTFRILFNAIQSSTLPRGE